MVAFKSGGRRKLNRGNMRRSYEPCTQHQNVETVGEYCRVVLRFSSTMLWLNKVQLGDVVAFKSGGRRKLNRGNMRRSYEPCTQYQNVETYAIKYSHSPGNRASNTDKP